MSKKTRVISLCLAAALAVPAFTAIAKRPKAPQLGDSVAAAPHPAWMGDAVIYEANLRQGTPERNLKGLQRQLPRIKDLGADIIWLMPIHPISEKNRKGTLGSYYAVQDYKKVNPEFGTMEDLKEFVRTAHGLGMKVIIDEVCNHTGADNVWITEHPDFYQRDKDGNLVSPYDWTDTYRLDYSNPAMREAMADAMKFWIREADIDGYRCDVAGEVPTDFWEWLRPQLQAIKPVFMLAEASKPDLLLRAFDADYAWPMKDVFNAIAATQGVNEYAKAKKQDLPKMTAADIPALLERQKREYPKGAVHMNMVTNHDLNSWEGTEFERFGPGLGAFAMLSYTLPGMPMLYTGQEVGFNHPFEFFETDTVQPVYTHNELTSFYEMLNALKHTHSALSATDPQVVTTFIPANQKNVLAFSRSNADDQVLVITNLSNADTEVSFPDPLNLTDGMINYFTGAPAALPERLAPWEYVVITK